MQVPAAPDCNTLLWAAGHYRALKSHVLNVQHLSTYLKRLVPVSMEFDVDLEKIVHKY